MGMCSLHKRPRKHHLTWWTWRQANHKHPWKNQDSLIWMLCIVRANTLLKKIQKCQMTPIKPLLAIHHSDLPPVGIGIKLHKLQHHCHLLCRVRCFFLQKVDSSHLRKFREKSFFKMQAKEERWSYGNCGIRTDSGRSRISQRRGCQPPRRGYQTIILVNFPRKLHEYERIWCVSLAPPLDPPAAEKTAPTEVSNDDQGEDEPEGTSAEQTLQIAKALYQSLESLVYSQELELMEPYLDTQVRLFLDEITWLLPWDKIFYNMRYF